MTMSTPCLPLRDKWAITAIILAICCGAVPPPHASIAQTTAKPTEEQSFRETTIYIPYEKLREKLEQPGRGVYLPYEEFQQLWQAARKAATQTPAPPSDPVPAVITNIRSTAEVQQNVVTVRSTVYVDVIGHGWISIPLGLTNVAIQQARHDGQPARLVTGPDGRINWLIYREPPPSITEKRVDPATSDTPMSSENTDRPEPFRVTLELEYAKSYTKTPGRNSVDFDAPRAAVNRWEFRVPEPDVQVQVHPMLAMTNVPPSQIEQTEDDKTETVPHDPSKETVVLAFVGATENVRLEWTPKSQGASGLDAIVSVQAQHRTTIEEGVIRTSTEFVYDITRAELQQLGIRLPADEKVVRVTDPNVRQWNVSPTQDHQTLTIDLFQALTGRQSIVVESERYVEIKDGDQVALPLISAEGANRQQGTVTLIVADGLRGHPTERTGLTPLDTPANATTPTASDPRRTMSWTYAAQPFQLAVRLEKLQPRVAVDQLMEVYVQPERLTVDWFARLQIEQAGIYELDLEIPSDLRVLSVQGAATSGAEAAAVDSFSVSTDSPPRLHINLAKRALGTVGIHVQFAQDLNLPQLQRPTGENSRFSWPTPIISVPSPLRTAAHIVVYAPESLRLNAESVVELRSVAASDIYAILASLRGERFPDLIPVLAYSGGERPPTLICIAERRQPQVTSSQLLVVDVETGVAKFDSKLFYDIRYSAVNDLRIDLPADIAPRVHNATATLRETLITPSPADLATGYVAWRFTADKELLGPIQIDLQWETPIENLGVGQSNQIEIPRLIPHNTERSDGQIVLRKSETIDLQPAGSLNGLEPIDPQHDVRHAQNLDSSAIALEYHGDWSLSVQATRFQIESLKHTSIEHAVIRTVVTRSNRLAVQALYRMRTNRQRLTVVLPDDVAADHIQFDNDPLRLNGRPVGLQQGQDKRTFHIPLVDVESGKPFLLELRYTVPGDGNQIKFPMFPEEPATQQVHLVTYIPEEQTLLGSRGPWTSQIIWQARPWWARVPVAAVPIEELFKRLAKDIPLSYQPASDFSVDGHALLFTTLRPLDPATDALQLNLIDRRLLHGMIVVLVLGVGILLLRFPITQRLVVICLVSALVLLAGIFLPTFYTAIMQGALAMSLAGTALLWTGMGFLSGVETWRTSRTSRPPRSHTSVPESPATPSDDHSPSNDEGSADRLPEGETDHA